LLRLLFLVASMTKPALPVSLVV